MAKGLFKSQKVDGITVSFDVNYEYRENISSNDLAAGENILDFNNKVSKDDDRSHISDVITRSNGLRVTGNTGEIYSDVGNGTVMHETGHLLGLEDRYEDIDGGNLGKGYPKIHTGYAGDIMASGHAGNRLDKSHYGHYIEAYGGTASHIKTANGKIMVSNGYRWINKYETFRFGLLTPYEINNYGIHKADPFKKRK